MLTERKVGLDQYGNLYTCIWASDILIDREINPFYLRSTFSQQYNGRGNFCPDVRVSG